MRYIRNFRMEYVDGASQYDTVDFEEFDVVNAEYIHVEGGEGKPDIEALPRPLTGKDAVISGMYIPDILRNDKADPSLRAYAIRNLCIPLVNQGRINETIYNGIMSCYLNRQYAITQHSVKITSKEPEKDVEINILGTSFATARTVSSALIGLPGTGKSTALNIALKQYPKAIRHRFEDGYYVQIPIVRTTAYDNNNLSALFVSFANSLDYILDTDHMHRNMLRTGNVGLMAEQIIQWIRLYHIGCWIIEEIEFFHINSGMVIQDDEKKANARIKSKQQGKGKGLGFENVVTIQQETGIFLFVTGNDDLVNKMDGNLRLFRRFLANCIDMNLVSQNKAFMKTVVTEMWKYMLPEVKNQWKEDFSETIYKCTLGSIDMISILFVCLQQEYIGRIKKNPKNNQITEKMIEDIETKQLSKMKKLFEHGLEEMDGYGVEAYKKEQERFELNIERDKQIIENAQINAMLHAERESGYNHTEVLYRMKDAFEGLFDYTDKQIENALTYCEKHVDNFKTKTNKEMKSIVRERLESTKRKKRSPEQKRTEDSAKMDKLYKELIGDAV